jgi:hypothetical protein
MPSQAQQAELCRHWIHAHEEDRDDVQVFRPEEHPLPPSRGRRHLELRRDGSLVETRPGADDRAVAARGRWALVAGRLCLFRDPAARTPDRELEVVSLGPDRLELRRTDG